MRRNQEQQINVNFLIKCLAIFAGALGYIYFHRNMLNQDTMASEQMR